MKIQKTNNLSFQKRLAAKSAVLQNGTPKKVYIYELDKPDDSICLYKAYYDKNWQDNNYLNDIIYDFEDSYVRNINDKYFVMEDEDKKVLCISVLSTSNKRQNTLDYIETAPRLSCYNEDSRPMKYIGETMVAFLAKLTQQQEKNLYVCSIRQKAHTINFYRHCGFKEINRSNAYMTNSGFCNLINLNETNTGSKIEIIA